MSKGTRLTEAEKRTIRDLLIDGHTIPEVVKATCFSRSSVNAEATKMRREGLPVAECKVGRPRKALA